MYRVHRNIASALNLWARKLFRATPVGAHRSLRVVSLPDSSRRSRELRIARAANDKPDTLRFAPARTFDELDPYETPHGDMPALPGRGWMA